MKKKRSTSSRIRDSAVLVVCLLGSFLSLMLFWRDLNRTLSKVGETPIATITFKYRVAQRKFIDRLVWDRLRQSGPIYNGDVIRTADRAEASLRFADETEISIGENSIIQVYFNEEEGASTVFGGGSIQIDSSAGGHGMQLISGSSSVTLDKGSSVSASGERTELPSESVSGVLSSVAKASGLQTSEVRGSGGGGIRGFFSSLAGGSSSSVSRVSSSGESPAKASSLSVQVLEGNASFVSSEGRAVTLGEGSLISADSGGVREGKITVSAPRQNSRYYSSGESCPVEFVWNVKDLQAEEYPLLEISGTKNFSGAVQTFNLKDETDGRLDVNLPDGTHYWRINLASSSGQAVSSSGGISGRVSVIPVEDIKTVSPGNGEVFGFRTTPPSARFAWTEDSSAVSYVLEISNDETMEDIRERRKIQNSSAVISSLDEGVYYWRVTPVYQDGVSVDDALRNFRAYSSGVSSFSVSRLAELPPPHLRLPSDGSFVDISSSRVTFSWENSQEAASYSLIVARDSSLSDSRKVFSSTNSFIQVEPENAGLTEGTWYWTVTQTDKEGTESSYVAPRSFSAVEGQVVFGTLFPENEYRISETLMYDTKFTWKNNIKGDLTLQIARDILFSDIVVNKTYSGEITGVSGLDLEEGSYYWRIISPRISETMEPMTSIPKVFHVQGLFPEPEGVKPADNESLRVLVGADVPFSWEHVEGAEYYQVKLVSSDGQVVYENPFSESNSVNLNSGDVPEGDLSWTIQAMATETPSSTRMTGLTARQSFHLIHLEPVTLVSPADNTEIDGVDAILSPGYVEWASKDSVTASYFILSRSKVALPPYYAGNKNNRAVVVSMENPERTIRLPVLSPGTYWWTVVALTDGGIDISAQSPRSFRILPLPKLPSPVVSQPADGTVFDPDTMFHAFLAGGDAGLSSLFTFAWQPVKDAEEYELRIYMVSEDGNTQVFSKKIEGNENTSFSLEDQSVLDEGEFVWTVEAKRYFTGDVIQGGEVKETSFVIDLPSIPEFTPENPGVLYGQ